MGKNKKWHLVNISYPILSYNLVKITKELQTGGIYTLCLKYGQNHRINTTPQ